MSRSENLDIFFSASCEPEVMMDLSGWNQNSIKFYSRLLIPDVTEILEDFRDKTYRRTLFYPLCVKTA
jgi:hypothetical protein